MLLARRFQVLAVTALTAAVVALPAGADAAIVQTGACDDASLTTPFASYGDGGSYKLAPGGDIEGSLSDWTLAGGAKKVAGSEPYAATGVLGKYSLSIPAGGSVMTPATCVNASYPSFRFFARSSGGLLGLLPLVKVDLVYRDGLLGLISVPVGTVLPSSSWTPSMSMLTVSAVGAAVAGGTVPLSLRFTALTGTWQVDDVFVDPYSRR